MLPQLNKYKFQVDDWLPVLMSLFTVRWISVTFPEHFSWMSLFVALKINS